MPDTCTLTQTQEGSASITIRGPGFPYNPRVDAPQIQWLRTHNGGFRKSKNGSQVLQIMPVLRWPRLPESDYDDLRGWLLDDVHLRMWLFSYTDPFGTTLTNMRYVKGLESFRRFSTGYAVGSIYIAKDWDA